MAFIWALIYFILCIINLIYNVFVEKYSSGLEAVLVRGITAIGIWLSWTVMQNSLKKWVSCGRRKTPALTTRENLNANKQMRHRNENQTQSPRNTPQTDKIRVWTLSEVIRLSLGLNHNSTHETQLHPKTTSIPLKNLSLTIKLLRKSS